MANDAKVKTKKTSKALPLLVFLIGVALIVGGVLMQIGYFGGGDNPVPEKESTETAPVEEEVAEDEVVEDEGTADASEPDFTITNIQDNEPIAVRQQDDKYTYADGAFAMIVEELSVTCENDSCGGDSDKVVLKFSTADGRDYPLTFTPAEPTQNLIDVPITIQEWHEDYVVIMITK